MEPTVLKSSRTWVVRAGKNGLKVDDFWTNSVVAIGWHEPGPISASAGGDEVQRLFDRAFPDMKPRSRRNAQAQVRRFLTKVQIGDPVATYDPGERMYLLGTITGEPKWRDLPLPRVRSVKWTKRVLRDTLTIETQNSLGSIITLFQASQDASDELWAKAEPLDRPATPKASIDKFLQPIDGIELVSRVHETAPIGPVSARPHTDGQGKEHAGRADATLIGARIRAKVERAIPDEANRRAALLFLADAIEAADEERGDAWLLQETRNGLALVTGRLQAYAVAGDTLEISVCGPVQDDVRKKLGVREEDGEAWRKIPGALLLRLPMVADGAAEALGLLKNEFVKFIHLAISRVRRPVNLETHIAEAVSYIAGIVGRDLPQPEAQPGSSEPLDEDEDESDDPTVTREPRVRGRAPIFEHGQRAIASLMEDIDPDRGVIALPALQRTFVWEDRRVRDLLDSLFIGFPVGTLVLWHTGDERDARALGVARRELRSTTLVIDGQQRLTSLYAVIRGKAVEDKDGSKRLITIAFRPRDGRFEVSDAAIQRDPEFLANVTELWNGPRTKSQIRQALLKELRDKGRTVDEAYAEAVDQNLDRAQAIRDYRFSTVDIRKTTAAEEVTDEDVAEIFVRINNQGTRLRQADFVLTLLAVFHGKLRDRIEVRAAEMSKNGVIEVDTQQVLRAACAVGFGRARMSAIYRYLRGVDPTTRDTDPSRRVERLEKLDRAATECLDATVWRDYMLRVMRAGFISDSLVASTNAVVNAFAFYVMGHGVGVPKQRLDEVISRWLFGTLLTARYSSSSETKFEEDLTRVRERDADGFVRALDDVLADTITGDYWVRTLPASLETQQRRAPAALAFRAAQVVLDARALFSDQLLRNLLDPPGQGSRAASEMHHLFPKAWLRDHGVNDRRRINQVANLADVGWRENSAVGKDGPATYVAPLRASQGLTEDRWGRMCAEHALPLGWESMEYEEFLSRRRPGMADVIRIAFRKLGGEPDAPPLTPPWFLPGAEVVWQRVAVVELALRGIVREVYAARFPDAAATKIEETLDSRERETLQRAVRFRPAAADPLGVVDYLYLAQLPALLFASDVWPNVRERLDAGPNPKQKIQEAVGHIVPVRNEIAHLREVSPDRLQRANVACSDLLNMLRRN